MRYRDATRFGNPSHCLPGLPSPGTPTRRAKWVSEAKNHIDIHISIVVPGGMMSLTAEYGVRAMVALCSGSSGELMGVRELAEMTGIPRNYLSKIMHALVRAGYVSSERGPRGGFCLNAAPRRITAYEVVAIFDDLSSRRRCFLGHAQCNDEQQCTAHEKWSGVWDGYERFLKATTIGSLAKGGRPKKAMRKARRRS